MLISCCTNWLPICEFWMINNNVYTDRQFFVPQFFAYAVNIWMIMQFECRRIRIQMQNRSRKVKTGKYRVIFVVFICLSTPHILSLSRWLHFICLLFFSLYNFDESVNCVLCSMQYTMYVITERETSLLHWFWDRSSPFGFSFCWNKNNNNNNNCMTFSIVDGVRVSKCCV